MGDKWSSSSLKHSFPKQFFSAFSPPCDKIHKISQQTMQTMIYQDCLHCCRHHCHCTITLSLAGETSANRFRTEIQFCRVLAHMEKSHILWDWEILFDAIFLQDKDMFCLRNTMKCLPNGLCDPEKCRSILLDLNTCRKTALGPDKHMVKSEDSDSVLSASTTLLEYQICIHSFLCISNKKLIFLLCKVCAQPTLSEIHSNCSACWGKSWQTWGHTEPKERSAASEENTSQYYRVLNIMD